MTPKEAIEYLNIMKLSTEDDSVGEIKKEVCDMAIKALEKQIPKKVINVQDCCIPETYDYDYSIANCPNCRMAFSFDEYHRPLYCNGCGQLIDWGEEE